MGQTQEFSRWVEGGLEVCKMNPLSQATHSKSLTGALPKVLSENRGPLNVTAECIEQTPLSAPSTGAWPFLQSQSRANFLGWCWNKKKNRSLPGMMWLESPRWTKSSLTPTTHTDPFSSLLPLPGAETLPPVIE